MSHPIPDAVRWIISENIDVNRAFRWGMALGLFIGWALWA
jgi:hypothetical protein